MDSERGRGGRKKFSIMKEDKVMKRPMILTKAKDDKSKNDEPVPTFILKTREGETRAVSPKPSSSKDATPNYQIAPRVSTPDYSSLLQTPSQMKSSVRLLDTHSLIISDSFSEYLTDSSDFLVVGCIGRQWVGKSTIMSHLVRPPTRPKKPSTAPSASALLADLRKLHIDAGDKPQDKPGDKVFRTMTDDNIMLASHGTDGIQAYINEDRVIFLDCQPIQSLSVLAKMCNDGSVRSIRDEDYMGPDNEEIILSLQLCAFILAVCHVVILIQDAPCDPDFIRFVLSSEILKPVSAVNPPEMEEKSDYFPQIMIVHNKSKDEDFSSEIVKLYQERYKELFAPTNFKLQTHMGIANGNIMATLNPVACELEPINFFLLPMFGDQQTPRKAGQLKSCFKGNLGYDQLIWRLRQQLLGVRSQPLTFTSLTEKNWWHYTIKAWDEIKKNTDILDYSRILPTPIIFKSELSSSA